MSGKSASAAPDNHAVVDAAQLQLERLSAADAPYDTPRFKVDPEHLHVALQLQFASPGILVERLLGAPERRTEPFVRRERPLPGGHAAGKRRAEVTRHRLDVDGTPLPRDADGNPLTAVRHPDEVPLGRGDLSDRWIV